MNPLQRYNIDTVFERTWNDDGWEECLQIEESDNGDWVKCEDVKKLEEQNELMLSILKDIDTQIKVGYDVYNILTPETISDISSIITDIEEQKEEENQ